jgi:hypothetical protein
MGGVGNPLTEWVLSPRSPSLVTLIIIYSYRYIEFWQKFDTNVRRECMSVVNVRRARAMIIMLSL